MAGSRRGSARTDATDPQERFTRLFERTHTALLAYALRRVIDPADAADVVAEAFLVAWRRIDEAPADDEARPWLFGIARRVLANTHRGARRRLALADRLREEVVSVVPPVDVEAATDVERALRRLPEDDQEVLRLTAWEQLAHDEVALVLGVSRSAARMRLHRARRRLAGALAEYAPAPAVTSTPAPVAAVATARNEDPR